MKRKAPSPASERLAGIEWMRGFAAFGVICIHAGLVVHNRTTPAAAELPDLFGFAVPFFLLISFFFAVRAEEGAWLSWGDWLQRRAGTEIKSVHEVEQQSFVILSNMLRQVIAQRATKEKS